MKDERGWKLVGLTLMLLSAAIMVFCVIGIFDCFWNVPAKKSTIYQLTQSNELLQAENEKLKTGMRFENLWLLTADQNDMMDFTMLEETLCEKRGLCK